MRAGRSGIIYDFIYEGAGTTGREKCGAKDVGFWLFKDLPKNPNFKVFFDNCFSTLPLLPQLKSRRILVTGTFRSNRIAACLLMVEKHLKKEGLVPMIIELNKILEHTWWSGSIVSICLLAPHLQELKLPLHLKNLMSNRRRKFKCNAMIWWHSIMHLGGKDFPEMLIELYHTKIAPWKSNGSWSSFDTASISLKSILGWLIVYIVDNYMYPVRSVFDFNNAESLHLKVKKSMRSTSSTHYWKLSQHLFQRYQVWQNCTLAWYRLRTFTL